MASLDELEKMAKEYQRLAEEFESRLAKVADKIRGSADDRAHMLSYIFDCIIWLSRMYRSLSSLMEQSLRAIYNLEPKVEELSKDLEELRKLMRQFRERTEKSEELARKIYI